MFKIGDKIRFKQEDRATWACFFEKTVPFEQVFTVISFMPVSRTVIRIEPGGEYWIHSAFFELADEDDGQISLLFKW